MSSAIDPPRPRGSRPKADPDAVRCHTIGVRVSASEYAELRERAAQLHMTPARWLREAALTRRLPAPAVASVNRQQYTELARLSSNLNQLTRLANAGERVVIAEGLLQRLILQTKQLRLALLGVTEADDDR